MPEINRHGILHFATHAHVATGAAQLSAVLLVDFRHPHFWAPFIHLGIP